VYGQTGTNDVSAMTATARSRRRRHLSATHPAVQQPGDVIDARHARFQLPQPPDTTPTKSVSYIITTVDSMAHDKGLYTGSASRHQLIVPRHRCTKFGRRAFSVVGPTAWNSLPDYLRDPSLSEDAFRRLLKTYLFALY